MKKTILTDSFLIGLSVVCLLPFGVMLLYSFSGVSSVPGSPLAQYGMALFQSSQFMQGFWNSFLYTVCIIIFNVPISLLAGYGFSCFDFKGKNLLLWLYIIIMLMPFQATIVPQYLSLKYMGILDNPLAVMLPNIFFTFGTFLMSQYMKNVDKAIFDAGRVDGLSEFGIFKKLVLPMCRPMVFAMVILTFINCWSMIEQPLIFLTKIDTLPLSLILDNNNGALKGISFACGTIFSILPLLLYIYAYDELVMGMSITAFDKGLSTKKNSAIGQIEASKNKKMVGKLIKIFILTMLICTLATQKIAMLMITEVLLGASEQKELFQDGKSLGVHNIVVPGSAILSDSGGSYIYTVAKSKQDKSKLIAQKIYVSISASTMEEAAITGVYVNTNQIVFYSTKALADGQNVVIIQEGK